MPDYVTLAEAEKLRVTPLDPTVIATIMNESPILSGGRNDFGGALPVALPFEIRDDRQLTIVRESTEPTVAWYDPNDAVTGVEGTTAQTTFVIRGLKTRVRIPTEIEEGYSSMMTQSIQQVKSQLKGMTKEFLRTFYYGKNASNGKEPDGLHALVSTSGPDMTIAQGSSTTAAALSLTNLDDMIYRMKGRPPHMLLCSRQMHRRFTIALRDTATQINGNLVYGVTDWGVRALLYGGIPLFIDDLISDTELLASGDYSSPAGTKGTSVFGVHFGPDALHAVSFKSAAPQIDLLPGPTQDYDGHILWIRWWAAFVLKDPFSVARVAGIDPTTAIVA